MQAPQLFRCVCGGEYTTKKGLDQHRRRYCRGADANRENQCEICEACFNTYAGLRQHVKRAHNERYNRQMQDECRGPSRLWTEDEINDLAQAEAAYNGENILEYLLTKSSRSRDAIKCRRKQPAYREKVELYRNNIREQEHPTHGEGEDDTSNNLDMALKEAITNMEVDLLTPTAKQLREDVLNLPRDVARSKLDKWCESWIVIGDIVNSRTSVNQMAQVCKSLRIGINDHNISAHRRRGLQYRLAQLRYKNDRKGYANDLLDGLDGLNEEVIPEKEEIIREYDEIFGVPSVLDDEGFKSAERNTTEISCPISTEDVESSLKTMKNGAPGPDGITLEKLKKIKINDLLLLFNSILFLEYIPNCFKICRTTLIPKTKVNLSNIRNWRPITISSMVSRLLGKILAKRTAMVKLHPSQKGFARIDGCFANNMILETIIKHRRRKGQPFSLISLDLRKAFDCVSHHSITRALNRLKLDKKFINIIKNFYNNTSTRIYCGGKHMGEVNIRRGVKQGDPLSPFLFNAILDEILYELDKREGISFEDGVKISALAYADDLVLAAKTPEDAGRMLGICSTFFKQRGLALNIEKCKALVLRTVPSKKKLCVVTEPTFQVGDAWIPQLNINEEFKYLGRKFTTEGIVPCNALNLHDQLTAIQRAPLKPQQKLDILKTFLIPRYIDSLQRPNVTKKMLRKVDLQIRTATKTILHLPSHCSNNIFYAPLKLGGLGIFCFSKLIPIITLGRCQRLSDIDDQTRAAINTAPQWTHRLAAMIGSEDDTAAKVRTKFGQLLEQSFSGNGIHHVKYHHACSQVISDPPRYWSGEDFIKAVHLRTNMLPTKGIPCVNISERGCRAGCRKTESLSHVLQGCPATHWERIHRHDYVLKRLVTSARNRQWNIQIEPRIRTSAGRLHIPDAILQKGNNVIVTDVQVSWEGRIPLDQHYYNKQGIYSEAPFVEQLKNRYPNCNIFVLPLIIGARGTWCRLNNTLARKIDLRYNEIKDLISTAMRGGWITHSAFMRRVWR